MKKLALVLAVAAASVSLFGCSQTQNQQQAQQPQVEDQLFEEQALMAEAYAVEPAAAPAHMAKRSMSVMAGQDMSIWPPIPDYPIDTYPSGENYQGFDDNRWMRPTQSPLSTVALEVDTASYANVRRFLTQGQLPPVDAVRTEELLNYFDYADKAPSNEPLAVSYQLGPSPWHADRQLLRVAMKSRAPVFNKAKNLVLLVDVSGSMDQANKLPLLRQSLKMLVEQMDAQDRLSIVSYAGRSEVILPSTSGAEKATMLAAIEQLYAGGGTNGEGGLKRAYAEAKKGWIKGGVNRVLLATDGDFNLGISDPAELERFIEQRRKSGVELSVMGFGQGNYNDALMERLSNAGNGSSMYIDSLLEAQKVLVQQSSALFDTAAFDAKLQLEFNPAKVGRYRLIGYENRVLNAEDFNDDRKDAGEVGANSSVVALYEIEPVGLAPKLRYQQDLPKATNESDELGYLKWRYKTAVGQPSKEYQLVVKPSLSCVEINNCSESYRFSAAVAGFGQKLRGQSDLDDTSWQALMDLAASAKGEDRWGYRGEFVRLVALAKQLDI